MSQIGRETGDAWMADKSFSMEMSAVNHTQLMDSPTMRKGQAIASKLQMMTPASVAKVQMKNGTSLASAGQTLRTAIENSDPAAIQRAVEQFNYIKDNPFYRTNDIEQSMTSSGRRSSPPACGVFQSKEQTRAFYNKISLVY